METSQKSSEEVAESMDMETPQKPMEKTSSLEVVQADTSTTAGGSPTSSEDSLVHDVDPSTFIPPENQDILLTDVTSERLHTKIGDTLGVEYLSTADGAQQLFMTDGAKQSRGLMVKPNNRYMINLVCRRDSKRNNTDSPRAPTTWHNVFFLVDTGSPNSFLCEEAMKVLIGRKSNIPCTMRVELLSGDIVDCSLPPADSHFTDVNILGSDIVGPEADLRTNRKGKEFFLTWP